jgi:PAS domain S-box-containing protein
VDKNQHLRIASEVLQAENERLRARLAGRREAESAISQRAEDFRALAENSPDVIVRLDAELRHLYVNPASLRMLGMNRAALLGRKAEETPAYDPLRQYFDTVRQVFTSGHETRIEMKYETAEERSWYDVRIVPEVGTAGKIETVLVVARDITERHQAEAALRRAEERFRVTTARSGMMVFEQDTRLIYTWVHLPTNVEAEHNFLGQSDCDLFPEEEANLYCDLKRQVLESGQGLRQELSLTMNGLLREIDTVLEPLLDETGQVVGLVGSAMDITDRKQAEHEQAYRAFLLENVHDAIVATDERLLISGWNQAAEQLYGWKAEEVLGRHVYEVIPAEFSLEDHQQDQQLMNADLAYQGEMVHYTREGRQLWVDCQSTVLKDAHGKLVGFVSANRDVTERRKLEEENHRQQELLEAIFQSNPGGLAVLSGPDMTFQIANAAYQAMTPHPEVNPVGKTFEQVWPQSEGFDDDQLLRPVLEEDASLMLENVERRYPDGSLRTFSIYTCPVQWRGAPGMLLVAWETTELQNALADARQRAAEAEEARRIFDALMEFIPEGITIASAPDLRVLYNSKYGAGLGNYRRADLENIGLEEHGKFWNAVRPDGVTPIESKDYPLARAARDGEVVEDEEIVLLQNGRKIHLLVNAGPILDAGGGLLGGVVAIRDITERKRSESHQQFLVDLGKALVALRSPEDILDGVASRLGRYLDADRCLVSVRDTQTEELTVPVDYHPGLESLAGIINTAKIDPRLLESLGNGRVVVIGDSASDPRVAESFRKWKNTSGLRALVLAPWINRERRWAGTLLIGANQTRQWRPDEIGLITSVADLAWLALENARLLQDLQRFRRRFEVALRNTPIFVNSTDRDFRITWAFNMPKNLYQGQWVGRRLDEILPPEVANEFLSAKQQVLESGSGMRQEVPVTLNGERLIYDTTIEPLLGPQGEIVGLTVAAMEVTSQRRMEAEALNNLAQIEVQRRLIHERERERTRIARELHDGPLQDMIATTYTLVEAMGINQKEPRLVKMRAIQHAMQTQVKELRRFCNELRPPALAPFGLEKTIRSHAESFQERFPDVELILNLKRDGQVLPEEIRMALFRIYQELLNNVARHAQAKTVYVRFALDDEYAVLEVEDDGVGFAAPEQWVEFARKGHLGLVGMQERVEMYGGTVEVDTQPGHGTRVRVAVQR